jgi:hypothetical protein
MLSRTVPARAAARSWAMTAATAASIRRGESRRSLASRAPRASSRSTALPMCRASRKSPEWESWPLTTASWWPALGGDRAEGAGEHLPRAGTTLGGGTGRFRTWMPARSHPSRPVAASLSCSLPDPGRSEVCWSDWPSAVPKGAFVGAAVEPVDERVMAFPLPRHRRLDRGRCRHPEWRVTSSGPAVAFLAPSRQPACFRRSGTDFRLLTGFGYSR